jgi:outer membrane protein OmpA-like peptidoglycan-associated protein
MMRAFFQLSSILLVMMASATDSVAQFATLKGNIYEITDHRNMVINQVRVAVTNNATHALEAAGWTDERGNFELNVSLNSSFNVVVTKDLFFPQTKIISSVGAKDGADIRTGFEMTRLPGFVFDAMLTELLENGDFKDSITRTHIEVYNNTTEKQILDIPSNKTTTFKVRLEQGNHYTMMIRKKGYFTKRVEAFVNVNDCILCFEGLGYVDPNVIDNMTRGNNMGTLSARIFLKKIALNQVITNEKIYYDYNKSDIRADAASELDKIVTLLNDNPSLNIELGSHTDSRGREEYNMDLSKKRAISAVNYIVSIGNVDSTRIAPQGYGETKLLNRCADGATCSEEDHQKNRRTELRITGIKEVDFKEKSLTEIIATDNAERIRRGFLDKATINTRPIVVADTKIKKKK